MNKRINLYYFGDIGSYDEYCPAFVCNKNFVPEILYLIAKNKPFTITKEEISNILDIESDRFEKLISSLIKINLINMKDNTYKVNFPIFLKEDLEVLDKNLNDIGKILSDIIIKNKEAIYSRIVNLSSYDVFSKERLLYHIICDKIFDGAAFEYFNEKGLFCVSKGQPGQRDYIAVGYEDSEEVESHSNKLLCSSNNFRSDNFTFNSFGNSNGNRKDMYRFFRMTEKALEASTNSQELNISYIKLLHSKNEEIADQCGHLILKLLKSEINYLKLKKTEQELLDFLKNLNYVDFNEERPIISLKVPIFTKSDRKIVDEISRIILNLIYDTVKEVLLGFNSSAKELTAIQHGVDIKEISNELWHQIFGLTNEYLAGTGFVEAPKYIEGQGRYLQSFSTLLV